MAYFYELKQGRYEWAESVLLASNFDIPPEEFRHLIEEMIAETPEWLMAGSRYHPDLDYIAKRLIERSDYGFARVQPHVTAFCKDERWKQGFEVTAPSEVDEEDAKR
jgi:hypothetical protein